MVRSFNPLYFPLKLIPSTGRLTNMVSWEIHCMQHNLIHSLGLTCDTVQSYTLVLPNGTISTIDSSQSDLFFALKGGLNRFGIVTSAVFSTHTQPDTVYVSHTTFE